MGENESELSFEPNQIINNGKTVAGNGTKTALIIIIVIKKQLVYKDVKSVVLSFVIFLHNHLRYIMFIATPNL